MPNLTGTSHVVLTVSDLDKSAAWYQKVLSAGQMFRGRSDQHGFETAYFMEPTSKTIFGLTRHDAANGHRFDARVPGLDHLSFAVESREDLEEWARHLDAAGVAHNGLEDQPFGTGLTLSDPDGIALEFYHLVLPAQS